MEHAIGTRITLEVVEAKELSCRGCYFEEGGWCAGECWQGNRSDHKNIIYKEIKEE